MNVSLESGFIPSVSDEDILRTSSDDSNRRRSSSDDGIDSSSPTDSEVSVAQLVSSPENNAKEAGNNSYIQLETLAGLSSTSRCFDQTANDDQSSRSGRNSLVSSLSSPSLDGSSANDGGKAADESAEGGSNVEEFVSTYKQQIPDLNKDQINDVFHELFSSSGALESNEKVRTKSTLPHKYNKFKDKTRLVQTVPFHSGAVWTMKFSPSGSYLCTAGQDTNVVIWCIGNLTFVAPLSASDSQDHIASADREKKSHEKGTGTRDFIYPEPYRILQGHTGDVVDVSWSKSHFILSASTDKTVCLWHVSRADCLQYFRHPDIITSVEFHPAHDRYYISGCFDRKIRVWDIIPDGVVLEWTQTTDTITSLCFSPDGKMVLCGLIHGKVFFYDLVDFDQLKYKTQMDCRNSSGKYRRGTKVTGLCFLPKRLASKNTSCLDSEIDEDSSSAINKSYAQNSLLVSTNDSRIRLCHLDDYSMITKYKGLRNKSMQIKATFSLDGKHLISGSEAGDVVIWSTKPKSVGIMAYFRKLGRGSKSSAGCESFDCTGSSEVAVTVAVFAPSRSVLLYVQNNIHIAAQSRIIERAAINASDLAETASPVKGNPHPNRKQQSTEQGPLLEDIHSRVIVAVDYNGVISIFTRLS